MTELLLHKGDITTMDVDAIVNAANSSLLGGGGVDGAIHRAAGPHLREECVFLNGCKTGEAKITQGYDLRTKYVIHAVGPVWHGGDSNERQLLHNAYYNSMLLAVQNGIRTIAFPNISTGVYHFPKAEAAAIAVAAIRDFITQHHTKIDKVFFVCFDEENYDIYQHILAQ
ncbi:O-acetyl-ADP-ribose deacetylase [Nemorincola caseinilytica]|uniref:O-acetyl-ADP-ribose deacetylase n=1 Tax=Nemorincola caseinilytica TaxID=2054315 RepID=A0ABP8N0Z0_9BACT